MDALPVHPALTLTRLGAGNSNPRAARPHHRQRSGLLAGLAPGVELDQVGRDQAAATGARLAVAPWSAWRPSRSSAAGKLRRFILDRQAGTPHTPVDDGLTEWDYGAWQGRALEELAQEKLWATVQSQPSFVIFPGGESMAAMQARSVAATRRHDAAFEAEHGPGAVWVGVSHGDTIKSVLSDTLGIYLDQFQRLHVVPPSVSIVHHDFLEEDEDADPAEVLRISMPVGAARAFAKRTREVVGAGDGHTCTFPEA